MSADTAVVPNPRRERADDPAFVGPDWTHWTLPALFLEHVRERPDDAAVRWREGDDWRQWTWAEYADTVARLAASFRSLGIQRGDRAVLFLANTQQFHVIDLALSFLGACAVSIYTTAAPDQIRYISDHCEAVIAFAEPGPALDRVRAVASELPRLRHAVTTGRAEPGVVGFDELVATEPASLTALAAELEPTELATIVYTSGTTGPPKGVMIDHRVAIMSVRAQYFALGRPLRGWRLISYMPHAHVGERIAGYYTHLAQGTLAYCCPNFAEIGQYLVDVRPQLFLAPPRVWEKLHATIAASEAPAHEAIAAVGLDECEVAVIGGAGLSPDVQRFFLDVGVPISEGYGLTESGLLTWEVDEPRPGTVGRALPGIELRLADDGEILCRPSDGPGFLGYLKDPERTAEVLTTDGWLRTGDLGAIDGDGYVSIVGRKKELIVTAGGKNVSPGNLEESLRAYPFIAHACVIGDGRPYIAALVVIDPAEVQHRDVDAVRTELAAAVATINRSVSRAESIRRVALLYDEWSPGSEELTATGKLRRPNVLKRYAAEIDAIYAGTVGFDISSG